MISLRSGRRGSSRREVAEQEVDVEAPLVGLVDDDRVVLAQVPVALELGEQDAVGHQLDPALPRGAVGEAHLVADQVAELGAELLGDPLGDRAGRDPARLGVPDQPAAVAAGAAPELEADLGQLGGLPGAGLAGDDDDLVVADRGGDVVAALADREVGRVGDVQRAGPWGHGGAIMPARRSSAERVSRPHGVTSSSGAVDGGRLPPGAAPGGGRDRPAPAGRGTGGSSPGPIRPSRPSGPSLTAPSAAPASPPSSRLATATAATARRPRTRSRHGTFGVAGAGAGAYAGGAGGAGGAGVGSTGGCGGLWSVMVPTVLVVPVRALCPARERAVSRTAGVDGYGTVTPQDPHRKSRHTDAHGADPSGRDPRPRPRRGRRGEHRRAHRHGPALRGLGGPAGPHGLARRRGGQGVPPGRGGARHDAPRLRRPGGAAPDAVGALRRPGAVPDRAGLGRGPGGGAHGRWRRLRHQALLARGGRRPAARPDAQGGGAPGVRELGPRRRRPRDGRGQPRGVAARARRSR